MIEEIPDYTKLLNQKDTEAVLEEVANERGAQDERWGQQDHDVVKTPDVLPLYENAAKRYRLNNDRDSAEGRYSWDGILLEEVYEALAATPDSEDQEVELIQVAAVCVAMVECIRRRRATK